MRERHNSIDFCVLYTGFFFSLLIALPFVFQSILFVFGIPLQSFTFPTIALLVFLFCLYRLNHLLPKMYLFCWVLVLVLLIGVSYGLCLVLYDFSYDGMWYQQDGVRLIAQGWNPYQQYLSLEQTSLSDIYVNHYPKASWITGGCIYAFTQKLESAKMINFFALYASFCYVYCALKSVFTLNRFSLVLFSGLVALNPVVIYQVFTFYVDGLAGSLLVCLLSVIVLFHAKKETRWLCVIAGVSMILFCVNIKFTTLIYVVLFMSGHFIFMFLNNRTEWVKHFVGITCVFLVGIVVLGWTSYVRNTIQYGHPFYPLMGNENVGKVIADVPMPANFFGKNRFEQFYLATFAKAQWSRSPNESKTKTPFTGESLILEEYRRADPEMGGFGPLFAEILLLVEAGCGAALLISRTPVNRAYLICLFVLLCSILIMPLFWYARYAPQLWVLVLLLSLPIYNRPVIRFWAYLVWILMGVNCYLVAWENTSYRIQQTRSLNQQFDKFKSAPKPPVIYDGWMESVKIKLKENDVMYERTVQKYPVGSVIFIPTLEVSGAFYLKSSMNE